MTIAVALSFDSGILLCADTQRALPARIPRESTNIFARCYGPHPAAARSIFGMSEASQPAVALVHECERALDTLPPSELALDRMRSAVEGALHDGHGRAALATAASPPKSWSCTRTGAHPTSSGSAETPPSSGRSRCWGTCQPEPPVAGGQL